MAKMLREEDAEGIIRALNTYVQDVTEAKRRMNAAMQECAANLPQDTWSQQANQHLAEALRKLDTTVAQAQELSAKVQKKLQEVQNTRY